MTRRSRRPWQGSDEQEQHLAEVERVFAEISRQEELSWVVVQKARLLGIPDTVIVERASRHHRLSRSKLGRKLGSRPDPGE